ncbi:MAG: thiamine phosphate synthase [Planctomycetota bacterium]
MKSEHQEPYRILDANANRASEGLRTLEEYARFELNSVTHTEELKQLRHRLSAAVGRLPRESLLRSRDADGDVGASISTVAEKTRSSVNDVVSSAASRTQQALRCLEEYGKTLDQTFAAQVESIRYRAYQVSAKLELASIDGKRLALTKLHESTVYALVDGSTDVDQSGWENRIDRLAGAGVDMIQLRDKYLDDRALLRVAETMCRRCRYHGILFIVNDRADIAIACDADGVHVGQRELPVDHVRRILGPKRLVGLSTHDIEQVRRARDLPVDYIGCGPTFPGRTKCFDEFPGLAFLRTVATELQENPTVQQKVLPAFAIGGIDPTNADQVAETGFTRVAVTAAVSELDRANANVAGLKESLAVRHVTESADSP